MAKPYSMDLRERVVCAVEEGGLSRHQAASRFGIGVSTAINWVRRFRETGSVAPGQMGGHKPKKIRGEHRTWLLARTQEKDFTLRGLVAEFADRGLSGRIGVSTAINWVRRFRETGSVAPGQMGGHKPKKIRGEHRTWLLARTHFRSTTTPCGTSFTPRS